MERAGRLHDIGKADRRFQRWLDPGEKLDGVHVAKSNMPRHRWNEARAAAGWPKGGRHEELSARLVRQWLERHPASCDPLLRDLLLHLIISHHGSGRPLVPPVADDTTDRVSGVVEGTSVDAPADLSIVDWEQPARFRRPQRPVRAVRSGVARSDRPSGRPCGVGRRRHRCPGGALMPSVTCPGLPASWINGWLAAVGATVLDSRIRLHWTADTTPLAVLSAEDVDPVATVVASWPDKALLTNLPISEHWNGAGQLRRKVSADVFAVRAQAARSHRYSWTLSSTMTDLCVDENGEVVHAPFDPAGPGTVKWLHHRLMKVHAQVNPSIQHMRDSFTGRAVRVKDNGLGFDHTRLGSQSDRTSMWIDPVVEVLAFFSLAILPMRGGGVDRRLSRLSRCSRGSEGVAENCWKQIGAPFYVAGVASAPGLRRHRRPHGRLDASQKSRMVPNRSARCMAECPVQARGSADTTRAFGAERL